MASAPYLRRFNSRTLGRVRLVRRERGHRLDQVSIHAPWEGCDSADKRLYRNYSSFNSRTLGRVRRQLSINIILYRGFNSRTLGRVRQYTKVTTDLVKSFNSRTLGRVRQDIRSEIVTPALFQFTHPGKGATSRRPPSARPKSGFQFTHPGKGATA